jgi:hypothetical protein
MMATRNDNTTPDSELVRHTAHIVARSHGLSIDAAASVLRALYVESAEELTYVAEHPELLQSWTDDATTDRRAGATGWVMFWRDDEAATSVTNGDPVFHENVQSLRDALAMAQGDEAEADDA